MVEKINVETLLFIHYQTKDTSQVQRSTLGPTLINIFLFKTWIM